MKTKLKKQEWVVKPLPLLKKIHKLVIMGAKKGVDMEVRTQINKGMIHVNIWTGNPCNFSFYEFHDEMDIEKLLTMLLDYITAESKKGKDMKNIGIQGN